MTISGREQAAVRRRTTVAKMIEALVSESQEQARWPGRKQEFVSAQERRLLCLKDSRQRSLLVIQEIQEAEPSKPWSRSWLRASLGGEKESLEKKTLLTFSLFAGRLQ